MTGDIKFDPPAGERAAGTFALAGGSSDGSAVRTDSAVGLTAESVCIHGLQAAWCAFCSNSAPRRARSLQSTGRSSTARHRSNCDACSTPIEVGDRIELCLDDRWRHDRCVTLRPEPETVDKPAYGRPVWKCSHRESHRRPSPAAGVGICDDCGALIKAGGES